MDPNATLKMIHDYLKRYESGGCIDSWCQDLHDWIAKGGFEPDWDVWPTGAGYYACRKVTMDKQAGMTRTLCVSCDKKVVFRCVKGVLGVVSYECPYCSWDVSPEQWRHAVEVEEDKKGEV